MDERVSTDTGLSPLLTAKDTDAPSLFRPENLLREARRQLGRPDLPVPDICMLDPDGDLVDRLLAEGRAAPFDGWACYHTVLVRFASQNEVFGIVGRAVGAPFAVLVAEQLFASGCRFLVSLTSAGRLGSDEDATFLLIERALRDEGTSLHYQPPGSFAAADPTLLAAVDAALHGNRPAVRRATTWTTDAPYRETETAITRARAAGAAAVEMEAAALYAFATARARPVVCFAQVTNTMAQHGKDFEKGEQGGTGEALALLAAAGRAWRSTLR